VIHLGADAAVLIGMRIMLLSLDYGFRQARSTLMVSAHACIDIACYF
jgi:hypothetical protein